MTRTAQRNNQGKIIDWNYTVYESPQFQDSPLTENRKVDSQPLTGFQEVENQEVENRTPLINESIPINDLNQLITTTTDSPLPEKLIVYEILKNDFHQDTPIARETVDGLIEKYGAADTKEAMKRAVIQGVAKLCYVIGILKSGLNTPKGKGIPVLEAYTKKVSADSRAGGDTWPVR